MIVKQAWAHAKSINQTLMCYVGEKLKQVFSKTQDSAVLFGHCHEMGHHSNDRPTAILNGKRLINKRHRHTITFSFSLCVISQHNYPRVCQKNRTVIHLLEWKIHIKNLLRQ